MNDNEQEKKGKKRSLSFSRGKHAAPMAKKGRSSWWPFGASAPGEALIPVPDPQPAPRKTLDEILECPPPENVTANSLCAISKPARDRLNSLVLMLRAYEATTEISAHPLYRLLQQWQTFLRAWDDLHVALDAHCENAVVMYSTWEKWLAEIHAEVVMYNNDALISQ